MILVVQVDQLGSEVLQREAYVMLHEMEPLYRLIKVLVFHFKAPVLLP